jgi:hypothetical protein
MELTQNDIDLLDRFSRDELDGGELAALQQRMKDADFATEVRQYLETVHVIEQAGRAGLKTMLAEIQSSIGTDEMEKYRPSKGSGGFGTYILYFLIAATAVSTYFLLKDHYQKTVREYSSDTLNTTETDTVYHYSIRTDTIWKTKGDSQTSSHSKVRTDTTWSSTVYGNTLIPVEMERDSSITKSVSAQTAGIKVQPSAETFQVVAEPDVKIPELTNFSLMQAKQMLKSLGLVTGHIIYKSNNPKNAVVGLSYMGKQIASGAIVPPGAVIDLVVGNGKNSSKPNVLTPTPGFPTDTLKTY